MKTTVLQRTPVALLIFNRPRTTRRVFEAVAKARPPKLLVVADGPRASRLGEDELCRETRAVIERVDWPCEVLTHFSNANLGCRKRITTGLDWVFSQVDEAIILEDDCLPDPSFFPFCEELLERYRHDERVHMVRGGNFLGEQNVVSRSYYFSRWYHIWGWATWARAWKHNDPEMRQWPQLRDSGWLERYLPNPEMVKRGRQIFDDAYAGLDTWEYSFAFGGMARNALAISPSDNLVTNIGFGPDATHLQNKNHPHSELALSSMKFPLRHPAVVEVDEETDLLEWTLASPKSRPKSLRRRLYERLLKYIN